LTWFVVADGADAGGAVLAVFPPPQAEAVSARIANVAESECFQDVPFTRASTIGRG
jgi:hypothetical protein